LAIVLSLLHNLFLNSPAPRQVNVEHHSTVNLFSAE
jgi:hypothetical protein